MGDLPKWKEKWSHCYGWPTQMEDKRRSHYDGWPTQMKNKKWSHYNGWPTHMQRFFQKNGLIVTGDLPRKIQRFFQKKWSHCYGWPTQKKWWSHYNGWPTQMEKMMISLWWVTYPEKMMVSSKAHSKGGRVRKRTTWEVRAQRRTQNEVGLANALPKRWWWNTDLTMLKRMHYDQYACTRTWENIGPPIFDDPLS
jgi:hypothetical protein